MSVVTRGLKNAFRNWLRTLAVVLILAIGIGLSLSMLVANQAVGAKINDLKTNMGTLLTISPAGAKGFEGGGEPLTAADAERVAKTANITSTASFVNFRLETETQQADQNIAGPRFMGGGTAGKTSLKPALEPGTIGEGGSKQLTISVPTGFSLPINGVGAQANIDQSGVAYNITSGRGLTANDTGNVAVMGKELAAKNSLSVGSTFTAYDQTFTVIGVFDQGTKLANAGLVIPLATAQAFSEENGQVGMILARVNSADNLATAQAAIKSVLGSDRADVASDQTTAQTAIDGLKGVQQISVVAFVGALVAAAVITFLVMVMVVRERKREIGVLKAIGGSNITIVSQFVVEALVLVVMGTIVGLGVAVVSSNGIASALVSSSIDAGQSPLPTSDKRVGGPAMSIRLGGPQGSLQNAGELIGQVAANVGLSAILYGIVLALVIGIAGSAVPAWLIAKVRPAEVMRGE